jgi:Txe/YoeB family toxin of toxin-antitoxin system
MPFEIKITKQAKNDREKVRSVVAMSKKLDEIIELLKINPYAIPPEYEKLFGDLKGLYSRRLNSKHRLVYEVLKKEKIVKIISMWTHYE